MENVILDDREIVVLAAATGLEIAPEFQAGVRMNLDLLRRYAALVEDFELSDRLEPAFEYVP